MRLRLRNKKTGETGDLLGIKVSAGIIWVNIEFHGREPKAYCYNSLAELNEEWEDADATIARTKNRIEFLERKLKSEKALLEELCGEEEE